jgi:hypothetical protein
MKYLVTFAMAVLFMASCKKESSASTTTEAMPNADFSFSKSEYSAYETIVVSNKSTDGYFYRWTLPDGTTSKNYDVTWTLGDTDDGSVQFKLEAISKSGQLLDYMVKRVTTQAGTGKVVFYSSSTLTNFNVGIDGETKTAIAVVGSKTTATCDESGCYTRELKKGIHTYQLDNGFNFRSGSFTITTNGCSKIKLD